MPTPSRRVMCATISAFMTAHMAAPAWAARGLAIDSQAPPTRMHADLFRFPAGEEEVIFQVLPAVVAHTIHATSPHPQARSLGGSSWYIPVENVDRAIQLAIQLQHHEAVDAAFPDLVLHTEPMSDDPNRAGQWYLDYIDMEALHAVSYGDSSVRVAVIDSGIDLAHPDLVDRIDAPYDAFSDDDDPSPNPGEYCPSGQTGICDDHGTAVSGVIAATADNGVGIRGMCPACTLVPIKMLGEGTGSLSADVAAFEHAIAQDAAVINNSWGYTRRTAVPSPLAAVIERALQEPRGGLGAVVVFAAGNDNREIGDEELQALPGVLCVSAIDNYGYSTSYTNFGPTVDVSAPSATVSITPSGDTTTNFGGTSAAAPVVAGLAAWIVSMEPTLSAREVSDLIVSTATESPYVTHDSSGHHAVYGYGIIHPTAILDAILSGDLGGDSGAPPETPTDAGDQNTPGEKEKSGCSTTPAPSPVVPLWILGGAVWLLGRRKPATSRVAR